MKIYVSHSSNFDFINEHYLPILNSRLHEKHNFILPHENSSKPYNVKELILKKEIDLVLAEVSYPSTGQGIELGWADMNNIKIISVYKTGVNISNSINIICDNFIKYTNTENLITRLEIL